MAGERAHAAAFIARLNAALGAPAADPTRGAFDYDDVPDVLPKIYATVTVSQRGGAPIRMCGGQPMYGWRATTRVVGRTVDEARAAREWIEAEIRNKPLVVDGRESTDVRFETEDVIEPDDGRYSGLTTWTYAL